ncbi:conserved hypothetical protein [Tolumonas auensis DSM 9187]|uniref:Nickel/cobalt transporter regulator n=1 Tax=Tolumonas auensis (strain DSM 9187 / NBRC 110442 / TA 4) TaxID=595494 RepID=C4LCU2_TOLAT|nr:hypothetical protein [Tolumonas auensis]ACQ92656.1 conserved hypothetical protein [Tolumonas auensis DSM 9187]
MRYSLNRKTILSMLVAGIFVANPAFAEKPEWKDNGNGQGSGKPQKTQEVNRKQSQEVNKKQSPAKETHRVQTQNVQTKHVQTSQTYDPRISIYFGDHHRDVIRQYYSDSYHSGHCPPGLAKKNNGCQPPGQAKKWRYGHPLPSDVIYYDLPPQVVISLGIPPEGQKYVRVASDILLIAVGTGLVLDAIQDLNNL